MIKLNGYYNEETLDELLYKGEITRLDYLYHHSEEKKQQFEEYCRKNDLPLNEDTALKFFQLEIKQEDRDHTDNLD